MSAAGTVLVTGGGGFVGVPTVAALLADGHDVVVLDNFSTGSRSRLESLQGQESLRVIEADLRDADAVRDAVVAAQPWGVVHLAAIHFIPYCRAHPAEALAINVLGLQHLLDALAHADVERLVFASTVDVYEASLAPHRESDTITPTNIYGASKVMGETLLRLWRLEGSTTRPVVARLSNVYGPGETNPHILPDILAHMRQGDVLPLGNVHPRRDYIYVEDIAAGLVALLGSDLTDDAVNLSTGLSYSVEDLVNALRDVTGRDLQIHVDPAKVRASDRPVLDVDVSKISALMPGREPTSLRAGLRRLIESEQLIWGKS